MNSSSRTQYRYTTRLHGYRFIPAAILAFVLGAWISGLFSAHATGDVTQALSASSLKLAETFGTHLPLPDDPGSAGSNQTIFPRGDALPTDPWKRAVAKGQVHPRVPTSSKPLATPITNYIIQGGHPLRLGQPNLPIQQRHSLPPHARQQRLPKPMGLATRPQQHRPRL